MSHISNERLHHNNKYHAKIFLKLLNRKKSQGGKENQLF